jgi:hypothetical protein
MVFAQVRLFQRDASKSGPFCPQVPNIQRFLRGPLPK